MTLQDIGERYLEPVLKFRLALTPAAISPQFQQISTTRWNIKLDETSKNSLFAQAYFLAIVQSPFYVNGAAPQLFFIEHSNQYSIDE